MWSVGTIRRNSASVLFRSPVEDCADAAAMARIHPFSPRLVWREAIAGCYSVHTVSTVTSITYLSGRQLGLAGAAEARDALVGGDLADGRSAARAGFAAEAV